MRSEALPLSLLLLVLSLSVTSCAAQKGTRGDGRCGPGFPSEDGLPARCEPIAPYTTCCQENQHCGWECDSGLTPPFATSAPAAAPTFVSTGKYRSDGRCGAEFPLESGEPAECDPNSQYWCCSEHGFCGGTQEHCYCETCVNYRPITVSNHVRSDRRCGSSFPLEDGSISECDGSGPNPCCSNHGYCGPGPAHCACVGCVDYTSGQPEAVPVLSSLVRNDRRCGGEFPLPDGTPSQCDPDGPNPCCSRWGYCGPGADHCECPQCVDYRTPEQKTSDDFQADGLVRLDRRCGSEFPLPDGSGRPSICDPRSADRFCCSRWGYCGGDGEHCDCPQCVNYRQLLLQLREQENK